MQSTGAWLSWFTSSSYQIMQSTGAWLRWSSPSELSSFSEVSSEFIQSTGERFSSSFSEVSSELIQSTGERSSYSELSGSSEFSNLIHTSFMQSTEGHGTETNSEATSSHIDQSSQMGYEQTSQPPTRPEDQYGSKETPGWFNSNYMTYTNPVLSDIINAP